MYAPANIDELTVEDLQAYEHGNAFCVVEDESDDEEAVETVPEEPEPEKPKRTKVDTGKIRALADAGWSVQKIADEMRLSWATVKKYLKEGLRE